MDYLYDILLYLPAVVCVHHIVPEIGLKKRSNIRRLTLWLAFAILIMAFSDAMFVHGASQDIQFLLIIRLICVVVIPTIPILCLFVACAMLRIDYKKLHLNLLLLIPLLWLTTELTFVLFQGWDNILVYEREVVGLRHFSLGLGSSSALQTAMQNPVIRWYSRLFGVFFSWFCTIEWLAGLIFILIQLRKHRRTRFEFLRYLFKDGHSSQYYVFTCWMLPVIVISMVRLAVGLPFVKATPWFAILYFLLLSVCLIQALYTATVDYLPTLTFKAIMFPLKYEPALKEDFLENPEQYVHLTEPDIKTTSSETTSDSSSDEPSAQPTQPAQSAQPSYPVPSAQPSSSSQESVPIPSQRPAESSDKAARLLDSAARSGRAPETIILFQHLVEQIEKMMQSDKLYLNPNLTIEDIAAELNTNRVYVSQAVNSILHQTFREYVNGLRIDYAKEFIREHPEATQDIIAKRCGFVDASAFNRKFTQVIGRSPREWALSLFAQEHSDESRIF